MKKVLEKFNPADFSFVGFQHLNILNVRSRQRIPQNCRTAAVIIFPYYNKSAWGGNISAYCSVADYHIVVMEQLNSIISHLQEAYPHNSFVPFVDSSPIDEVDMAVKAGLGVKGQNSLLITENGAVLSLSAKSSPTLNGKPPSATIHTAQGAASAARTARAVQSTR